MRDYYGLYTVPEGENAYTDGYTSKYIDHEVKGSPLDPDMEFVVRCTTSYKTTETATLRIRLYTSATVGATPNTVALIDKTIAVASLVAGNVLIKEKVPAGLLRCSGVHVDITAKSEQTPSAGAISAGLEKGNPYNEVN